MTNEILNQEDYIEPRCLLCEEPYGAEKSVRSVPQMRIIDKMNEYMARRDYEGAERHLLYWLEEAELTCSTGSKKPNSEETFEAS